MNSMCFAMFFTCIPSFKASIVPDNWHTPVFEVPDMINCKVQLAHISVSIMSDTEDADRGLVGGLESDLESSEEDLEEAKANEDHHVHILKHWKLWWDKDKKCKKPSYEHITSKEHYNPPTDSIAWITGQ